MYADDMGRQVEASHFCINLRHDLHQCVIFDRNAPGARLIGIEYSDHQTDYLASALSKGDRYNDQLAELAARGRRHRGLHRDDPRRPGRLRRPGSRVRADGRPGRLRVHRSRPVAEPGRGCQPLRWTCKRQQ
jgi:hypothetical protein